jgi:diadenylate cyclase
LTWQSGLITALDIALVFYVLLRLLRLVRGTRTGAVLVGLLVVFVGWWASGQLGLSAMHTLLDRVVDSLVIIIVVVFQADIRRALARMGGSARRWGRTYQSTQIIPEIVAAVARLADKSCGALIVIERGGELGHRIEGAAQLDATVSRGLLLSIFHPDSPLHDGAVVIREGRVAAAGYFMPISSETQLPDELGTRHRAAISLTEDVDAVVLVVSEERGEISMALDGQLRRAVSTSDLTDELQRLLGSEDENRWRKMTSWWRGGDRA